MSGSDANINNSSSDNQAATHNGDYTRINWNPPGTDRGDSVCTKNATLALKTAIAVARAFDANCALRNPAKECTIPMFEPQELILGEPLRSSGFFTDIHLRGIKLTRNLIHGEFSEDEEEFRERFAERSIDGHYAVKVCDEIECLRFWPLPCLIQYLYSSTNRFCSVPSKRHL
jgi:hypothetical protein